MSLWEHLLIIALAATLAVLYYHHKRSEQRYNEIVKLRDAAIDISNHMMDMETSDEGFQYILEKCIELIPDATLGSILMLDDDGYLTAHAHLGFLEHQINDFKIAFTDSFIYHKTGGSLEEVVIINDLKAMLKAEDTVETNKKGMVIQSQLTAPLMDDKKLIGVVCIDSLKNHVFSENDRVFLEYMMNHVNGITKQQYLRERVVYHSRHDCLTQLYNRSHFDTEVTKIIEKKTWPFILCEMDLDGLKRANDLHGHLVGDQLIQRFGEGIRLILKEGEFAGRYGGDEFMVCFFEETEEAALLRLKELEKILLGNAFYSQGEKLYPKFSYGLVKFPEEGRLLDILLLKSDERMYRQKNNKKSKLRREHSS